MSKKEFSGVRDLSYSRWHRKLPGWCWMIDLDAIEIRKDKIVALIETKDIRAGELPMWRKTLLMRMGDALSVPAYVVYHNLALDNEAPIFKVKKLGNPDYIIMIEAEYQQFIMNLGG